MNGNLQIDLNACISGRSLLSSTAKILKRNTKECTYLEFRTFCDFLEAISLHDTIYIITNIEDITRDIQELVDFFNNHYNRQIISFINIKEERFLVNSNSVDTIIKELIDIVFDGKMSFIRQQLYANKETSRRTDDSKDDYLECFTSLLKEENYIINEKYLDFFVNTFHNNSDSEFKKHLFRAIIIAAVAIAAKGTAKFTGTRKSIGGFIIERYKKYTFSSFPHFIYCYANSLYMNKKRNIFFDKKLDYYHHLLLSIYQSISNDSTQLKTMFTFRDIFEGFRNNNKLFNSELAFEQRKIENAKYNYTVYLNDKVRLLSKNNLVGCLKKYFKEIFLDKKNVNFIFNTEEYSNTSKNDFIFSSSINVTTLIKNFIKYIVEYFKSVSIAKKIRPLDTYLIDKLNSEQVKFFKEINKYYLFRMRIYDTYIRKYKL